METTADTQDPGDPREAPSMQQLPASTVRLIASSQVITSVVSVVKELVENSLDAEASSIEIKLEGYGLEKVEVRDNGCGIKPQDTPYMARPHYTSKITNTQDLDSLTTYGFRGEALGSLCSVSDISITTKTPDDDVSMTYTIDHSGHITTTKPSHLGQGTTVSAANLFKNLPVRKQFYNTAKKKKEELKKVEDLIYAFGVVNHGVRLVLRHGKDLVWQKSAVADPRSALLGVIGTGVMTFMEHVKRKSLDLDIEVEAFLPKRSSPSQSTGRISNDRCFVFVNKRPVSLKAVDKLLRQYYCSGVQCEGARYPIAYLHIIAAPDCVDVNVDPNKTQVMLHNKEEVLAFLRDILEEIYGAMEKPSKETTKPQPAAPVQEDTDFSCESGQPVTVTRTTAIDLESNSMSDSHHPSGSVTVQKAGDSTEEFGEYKLVFHDPAPPNENLAQLDKSLASNIGDPVCHSTLQNIEENCDFQPELSDLELLQCVPDLELGSSLAKSMELLEGTKDETHTAIKQHTPAVPLTQSLNFDLALDCDDLATQEPTEENLGVDVSSKESPAEVFHCDIAGAGGESSANQCAAGFEPTNRTEAGETSQSTDASASARIDQSTEVPGVILASAVAPKIEKDDEEPAANTAVDWSRGVAVDNEDGSTAQPVTLLRPPTGDDSLKIPPPPRGRKKSIEVTPTQATLYDLVGNCTVKRPTTAYIYFSKEMRPQVVAEHPKAGFQDIARIIGDRWKGLSEAEKEKYDRLMTKDVQRYREQVKQAGNNNNGSCAKKLHQSKRRKLDQSCIKASLIPASDLPPVKTVTTKFSLLSLKQKFDAGFRPSQQWNKESDSFKPIGQLKSHAVWLCRHGNKVVIIQPIRAQEELILHRLLANHSLPLQSLETPIPLADRTVGLETAEKATLSQMEKSAGQLPDPYTYYTDPRLVANGFKIREIQGTPGEATRVEICQMAACMNFYGVKDLREVLQHVGSDSRVQLAACRPARVHHYLQGEAVRMARQLPQRVTRGDLVDIMGRVDSQLGTGQSMCFHKRPFVIPLYDLEAMPPSQNSGE